MRTPSTAVIAIALGIAWGTSAGADDKKVDVKGDAQAAHPQTIVGMIAGVTTEGETAIDAKSGRAVMVEAAFLTIVGSPKDGDAKLKDDKDKNKGAGTSGADRSRANVYIAWLSPRTKVCECTAEAGKSDSKKDVGFEHLQLGDRVEVQFVPRDNSGSTDKAAKKHGRHRTYRGDANAITILPARDHDHDADASRDHDKGKDQATDKAKDSADKK